jgi:hypothetical protein
MTEDEMMRKYAEAHGFEIGNEQYVCPRPLPCVRDEHGEIREQPIKVLLSKVDEELNELKEEIYGYLGHLTYSSDKTAKELLEYDAPQMIEEEAADTITAITTMLEALGIDAEMRDEAQRRVNKKNMERGRL